MGDMPDYLIMLNVFIAVCFTSICLTVVCNYLGRRKSLFGFFSAGKLAAVPAAGDEKLLQEKRELEF